MPLAAVPAEDDGDDDAFGLLLEVDSDGDDGDEVMAKVVLLLVCSLLLPLLLPVLLLPLCFLANCNSQLVGGGAFVTALMRPLDEWPVATGVRGE